MGKWIVCYIDRGCGIKVILGDGVVAGMFSKGWFFI